MFHTRQVTSQDCDLDLSLNYVSLSREISIILPPTYACDSVTVSNLSKILPYMGIGPVWAYRIPDCGALW